MRSPLLIWKELFMPDIDHWGVGGGTIDRVSKEMRPLNASARTQLASQGGDRGVSVRASARRALDVAVRRPWNESEESEEAVGKSVRRLVNESVKRAIR